MPATVHAARPLLDSHQWDAYFALFAPDASVPNRRIAVRLDTFSGAPVDFTAYAVDPADVLVAGAAARPRALDTAHRTAVARWRFTPPAGYQLESNDVEVPLQNREGFYVIEARRGDAVQQAWLNVSRVGLVAKESAAGVALYGADLMSGRPLAGMRLQMLVGSRFVTEKTDEHGFFRYAGAGRPRFVLAQWGASQGFLSFAAQAPPPPSVVGVRLDRGSVRAGERIRAVGFARKRAGGTYVPATGDVRVVLTGRGKTLAQENVRADASGAFDAELTVPHAAAAGDAAVLATADGASGGASLHIDSAGDAVVAIAAACGAACAADKPLPLAIQVRRDGAPMPNATVRVHVTRSPHIVPPGEADDLVRFGTSPVLDVGVTTDAAGSATAVIPAPSDGLASTYGITAVMGGATATTRVTAQNARIALAVEPEETSLDVGVPANVYVRGFDAADGTPAAGTSVRVRIAHGPQAQEQTVKLDANGRARASFAVPNLGANIVTAEAQDAAGVRALDAAEIVVAPQSLGAASDRGSADIAIVLDKARYRPGDVAVVHAELGGAYGSAFVTLEGPRVYDEHVVDVRDGRLTASFTVPSGFGETSVGVAFVRNGSLLFASAAVVVDGPGQPRATTLASDRAAYAPGEIAHVRIHDNATKAATLVVRLADGRATRGAAFDDAPNVLAGAGTTTRANAADPVDYHAWVAPARSKASDLFAFDRPRSSAAIDPSLAISAPHAVYWKVERTDRETIDIPMPAEKGQYVLSLLKVHGDGDVGAASLVMTVR
jgi:hypothetical protein